MSVYKHMLKITITNGIATLRMASSNSGYGWRIRVYVKAGSLVGWVSVKRIPSPDSGLTDTYSTIADSRSCGVYCRSFDRAWLHLWIVDTLSHCRQCGRHGQYSGVVAAAGAEGQLSLPWILVCGKIFCLSEKFRPNIQNLGLKIPDYWKI